MYAHKIRVIVEPGGDLRVKLPSDFPSGFAEVIVLAEATSQEAPVATAGEVRGAARSDLLERLARRFPPDPTLAGIVVHEDPTTPLDEDDWPASFRP